MEMGNQLLGFRNTCAPMVLIGGTTTSRRPRRSNWMRQLFCISRTQNIQTSRRDRCGCKPMKEDVKKCFLLEFDGAAFIIASTATREEMLNWYQEHVVWGQTDLKLKLLKKGILTRVYAPMAVIQGLRVSGLISSVIKSAQASSSENQRNLSSTVSLAASSLKFQAAARKMLETTEEEGLGSRSDHPVAVCLMENW